MKRSLATASTVLLMLAAPAHGEDAAYRSITADDLAGHIEILSSDDFLGRGPGTEGEDKTVDYLVNAFQAAGASGGYKNKFTQKVPLTEITRIPGGQFNIHSASEKLEFTEFDDFVNFDGQGDGSADITNAPLVFVGYGITAPEYGWDDYKDIDVTGAIVIALRGEPSREDDEDFFSGRHLTPHYHQHTKYDLAAKNGAKGIILVHTEASAGWPWSLLQTGGAGKSQSMLSRAPKKPNLDIHIQLSEPATEKLFKFAGMDFQAMAEKAKEHPAAAVQLGIKADASYSGEVRKYKSKNVVAKFKGSEAPEECVIYTAHWDHVGVNDTLEGDQIFNGAVDNATGTAAMIELAEAYSQLKTPPRRSVYIVATTAEEKGLLGAKHLVENPLCAPENIVAVLNMDSHFPFGSFPAMTIVGYEFSEIQEAFKVAANKIGRILQADSNPEVGAFYRNDAYPFSEAGIPAIFAVGGPVLAELEEEDEIVAKYTDYGTNKYHKPADEYDPETWDMTGIEEDARIFFDAGLILANSRKFPNWRYDLPFRERRDAMRSKK